MHPLLHPKYTRRTPQTLAEVIRLVENLSAAHQLTATLTPSIVSMISGEEKCFVCGGTSHFGCHWPDAQCYGWDEFGHFAQDCLYKIPSSGIPCNHGRSHLRQQCTHNHRDRSHSYYGSRHRTHYSRSQFSLHSQHDRSSSFRRHTHAL